MLDKIEHRHHRQDRDKKPKPGRLPRKKAPEKYRRANHVHADQELKKSDA